MTTVGVTCIQLLRDLAGHRGPIDDLGWSIVTPEVRGQHLEGEELIAAMQGCVGVVAGDDKFTADVLDALPDLRVISKWGIGIDGIDLIAAAERGIVVRNTPGMFDDEVADVTMAYITMLARQLAFIDRGIRQGAWPKPAGTSLRGLTVGIIGLGGIGRAVARRTAVAGMAMVGVDPSPESQLAASELGVNVVELDELLRVSDVISVNCPLNASTFHLLDEAAFRAMKPGVFIVNTGRGPVIETAALIEALEVGRIGGAAVDVLEIEPPEEDSPLKRFDNVIFGSHNASNTLEASARTSDIAITHLIEEIRAL
ncbi:MAG: NAD(P)-dependent oxidoreductase [Ilumatobacter sp.]|uniref:NAD(P)-dependent oxidoreductase n=1 Tax=Ilumatobacter sp. TaxID=1967498 RepID=UPI00391DCE2A